MRVLTIILCLFSLAPAAYGFRSALALRSRYTHLSATKNLPDGGKERNWFQQMVQAFIEAFPQVLKPPKEMDPSKVIYDPASFDTVVQIIFLFEHFDHSRTNFSPPIIRTALNL